MLDTIEQTRSLGTMMTQGPLGAEDYVTATGMMVPLLDWPRDLFNKFTAEADDEFE